MKCSKCGIEFEGNFCPNCGTSPAAGNYADSPAQQQMNTKKKKPFFLRWWFILLAIIVIGIIALSNSSGGEKIVWKDIILGEKLPQPAANKGDIHTNTTEQLWIDINKYSDRQYADYIEACKAKGFTIDEESESHSYEAYNSEGYKLALRHFGNDSEMGIDLKAPMEMSSIVWPSSAAGNQLPTPKSTIGNFSYEHDDSFLLYLGDTTRADYDAYVEACSERGFNINFDKNKNYYSAKNSDGWRLSIGYEGNSIIKIDISGPSKKASKPESSSSNKNPKDKKSKSNGIDPGFKKSMDSYEKFIDEYVKFMKKYEANPTDLGLLEDYTKYMSKYNDFLKDFEKWEKKNLNAKETAYYLDVQARVSKKLIKVSM